MRRTEIAKVTKNLEFRDLVVMFVGIIGGNEENI